MTRFACVDAIGQPVRPGYVVVTFPQPTRPRPALIEAVWESAGWWSADIAKVEQCCEGTIIERRTVGLGHVVVIGRSIADVDSRFCDASVPPPARGEGDM